ncbi:MAG: GWxTD domain-containing protein [bacterium]
MNSSNKIPFVFFTALFLFIQFTPARTVAQTDAEQNGSMVDTSGFTRVPGIVLFDVALMKYNESMSMLQIDALVERDALATQTDEEEGVEAVYEICFNVRQGDQQLAHDNWKRRDWSKNAAERKSNVRIPEIARFGTPPGQFTICVRVVDLVGHRYEEVTRDVSVGYYTNVGLQLSDILFASYINQDTPNQVEYNFRGMTVIPDAESTFGDGREQLHWYLEIYNLLRDRKAYHTVQPVLFDSKGVVKLRPPVITGRNSESDLSVWGEIDLTGIEAGDYRLQMLIVDKASGDSAVASRPLAIKRLEYREDLVAMERTGLNPDSTSDDNAAREFQAIQYLLPIAQQKMMRRIVDPQKQRILLTQIYTALDPDTTTATNEFRQQFLQRLAYVNESFGRVMGQPGWKRDRGRVYLKYGPPDYIEDHGIEPAKAHAYQIWEYPHLEGGVIFVFVDRNDVSLYSLVHSTKHDELYAPGWRERELFVQSSSGATTGVNAGDINDNTGIGR